MKSLIVIDDLMELLPSRNRFIRNGTSWYAGHLARQTEKTIRRLKREGNYPVGVAGPKAVLDQISSEVEKFDYSFWFDTIEFAHGGKISAQLADPFEQSRHVQSACPDLFVGKVSIPKIASIRFRISICYNAVNNYLLLQNIITKNSISSVVVISGTSEIEKIALAIAKRDNLAVKVARPHNLRCVIKAYFSNYVYFRDRKLHARASLSRARVDSEPILPTQKKLICLAPAHSLHFRMLMPLAQMLNRSENYEAVVLLEDTMSAYGLKLKELGIRFYSLAGESKKRLYDELNKQVKNLVKAWDQLTRIQDFKREFESEGVDWFSILKDKWRWYFRFSYAETCVMKKRIMNVLRATKPAAVITVSDSRFFDAGSAAAAKELQIPTFLYSQTYLYDTDSINEYETSDHVLTVGENMKKYIASRGRVDSDRIAVVGDIRLELEKEKATPEEKARLLKSLGISPDKKVFIASSFYLSFGYTNYDKQRFFEMIQNAVRDQPNIVVIVKAHPNENFNVLKKFIQDLGIHEFVITETSMFSLFTIASGLLTLTSLSAIEAMAFSVPVIVLTLPDRNYDYYIPLRKSKQVECCGSAYELSERIKLVIGDIAFLRNLLERQHQFVSHYIDQSTPSVARRITDVLDEKLRT